MPEENEAVRYPVYLSAIEIHLLISLLEEEKPKYQAAAFRNEDIWSRFGLRTITSMLQACHEALRGGDKE